MYVRERIIGGSDVKLINAYKGLMERTETLIVDGKQFLKQLTRMGFIGFEVKK